MIISDVVVKSVCHAGHALTLEKKVNVVKIGNMYGELKLRLKNIFRIGVFLHYFSELRYGKMVHKMVCKTTCKVLERFR